MARARAVGSPVLVLTIDLAVVGARHRDMRNGILGRPTPWGERAAGSTSLCHPRWVREVALGGKPLTFGNLEKAVPEARTPDAFQEWVDAQFDPSVTWDDIAWVREHWDGRLLVKGVLDPEDARRAVEAGVDGIVVSNHGGRQLDSVPSTARALPEIADAVGDRRRGARRRRGAHRARRGQDARARRERRAGRAGLGVGGRRRAAKDGVRQHARGDQGGHRRRAGADRLHLGRRARPLDAGGRRRRR